MVEVNRAKIIGRAVPFCSVKRSDLGRKDARQGIEAFTEIKHLCLENT